MDSTFWAKAHGATTHFPLALVLCSGAFDGAGFIFSKRDETARGLHTAGYWTMLLSGLGVFPAVFSGLSLTHGKILGHGALRLHHLFVWPAFALIVALAVWRLLVGPQMTRGLFAAYLATVGLASGLVLAAGYWGGEMMIAR